jgi:L-lysine 2,3-aminomutase
MPTKEWRDKNVEKVRASRRLWYSRNSERAKEKVTARKRELDQWFAEYKKTLKCSLCPEDHPAALDFHHLDPSKKELSVTVAVSHGWSRERLLKEIEKCQVLCSNCHRKLHYDKHL